MPSNCRVAPCKASQPFVATRVLQVLVCGNFCCSALPAMSTKQLSLFSPAFATQRPASGSSDSLALAVLLAQSYPNGLAAATQIHLRVCRKNCVCVCVCVYVPDSYLQGQREAVRWTRVSPDAAPVRVEMVHLVNFSARRITLHVRVVNDCKCSRA